MGRARPQSLSDRLAPVTIHEQDVAERLRALIRDVPDFPRPGIVFRDITVLLGDGPAFGAAISALAAPYSDAGIALVAGIESRGFILGGAVADRLGSGFVPIRKEGRLPAERISQAYSLEYGEAIVEIHADAITAGQRVLIVDDLLATGGTAAATAALVDQLGGAIAGFAFLVELSDLGGSAALRGRPYTALLRMNSNGGIE